MEYFDFLMKLYTFRRILYALFFWGVFRNIIPEISLSHSSLSSTRTRKRERERERESHPNDVFERISKDCDWSMTSLIALKAIKFVSIKCIQFGQTEHKSFYQFANNNVNFLIIN